MAKKYSSWGLTGQKRSDVCKINWRTEKLPKIQTGRSILAYGNGRSYGDSCLNKEGLTLDTEALNHLITFDEKTNILRCETGVLLKDILNNFVPKGWFIPVTPGTKFITIGGAIANDVHGKNHHRRGSFGNHVIRLKLLRSDGEAMICSRTQHPELFRATIGGLGLTGLILWADVMLMPIDSSTMYVETTAFEELDDFFELSARSEMKFEYSVAWLDCATKNKMGRGIFMRANHCARDQDTKQNKNDKSKKIPFYLPGFLVNNFTSRMVNRIYYNAHPEGILEQTLGYDKFFYPLDRINNWNRIYGKKGLFQYQCVVPLKNGKENIQALINEVQKSGISSPLAVLKIFGSIPSKGIMSFPREGVTLAMDFPNVGSPVLTLFNCLDNIVANLGGAVYPAKDACMNAEHFRQFFPNCDEFKEYIDPAFSSSFWQRVMA